MHVLTYFKILYNSNKSTAFWFFLSFVLPLLGGGCLILVLFVCLFNGEGGMYWLYSV